MRRKATRIEEIIAAAARSGDPVYVRVGNGTPVAELWLDGSSLIAATAEGGDHRLGARLVSTGHLARAELDRSRSVAAKQGASLAVTLSERVRRDVLSALAYDEARYALAAALAAPEEEVEAGRGPTPEGLFPIAADAADLLARTQDFLAAVRDAQQHAPANALPVATEPPPPDLELGAEEWALLSRADGTVTVADLAEECGFPQPEASLIVTRLVSLGLVRVEDSYGAASELLAELEAAEDLAAISAAFEHAAATEPEPIELEPQPAQERNASLAAEGVVVALPVSAPAPDYPAVAPEPPGVPALEEVADPPVELPTENADRSVDTQALLRELASIARAPDEKGR